MKKLIISALCLIGCFAVCIQPVYADDSDNVKTGDRIDDDENSQPNYAKKVCKYSKKLIHDTNAWLSHDTYTFFICILFGLIIIVGIFS